MKWTEIIKVYIGESMRNALNHQLESILKDLDAAKNWFRTPSGSSEGNEQNTKL